MKAVIVETHNKFVAAMTDDGRIIQLKNKNYVIGQVIEMNKIIHSYSRLIAGAASAAAVIAISSISVWAYNTPYSYVSLDVNPSIEYSLNRFDRVLSADAVNDDGEVILDNLDLENKSIEDAIEETIQEIANNGYLTDTELGGMVIATSSDDEDKAAELADAIQDEAETTAADSGIDADVEVLSIGKARVDEAKALGVTPGKLNLVQKLQESNPDEEISTEDWLNQPVKNIMKAIKENRKAAKTPDPQESEPDVAEEITTTTTAADPVDDTAITAAAVTTTGTETSASVTEKQKEKTTAANANKNKNNSKPATEPPAVSETTTETAVTESNKKNEDLSESKAGKGQASETKTEKSKTEKSKDNSSNDKQEKQNKGKSNQ